MAAKKEDDPEMKEKNNQNCICISFACFHFLLVSFRINEVGKQVFSTELTEQKC